MSYCAVSDIFDELSRDTLVYCLYEEPNPADTSDLEARIQKVIDKVEGKIDGFLEGRYSLPLTFESRLLKTIAVDLVKYEILARRGLDDKKDSEIIEQKKEALRLLEKIAGGKLTLEPAKVPAPETNVSIEVESSPRIFSRDKLKGM